MQKLSPVDVVLVTCDISDDASAYRIARRELDHLGLPLLGLQDLYAAI